MIVVKLSNIHSQDADIIGALLTNINQEGWQETENDFEVYFKEEAWLNEENQIDLKEIAEKFNLEISVSKIENINWNEQWEKDYEPVYIDNKVYIKSTFHPQLEYQYTITIQPKMSFGTGHHATTRLMCLMLLELDCKDINVIDIGTGTGVLAILARMLGANHVLATDNDIWCYENTLENIQLNNLTNIEVNLSESLDSINQSFDIIIANIHKNYQLENMGKMKSLLNENGFILISGFYQEDAKEILNLCSSLGLVAHSVKIENNWCAICLTITD